MSCWLIWSPVLTDDEFRSLRVTPTKTVHFYSLIPLFEEEMNVKLRQGTDALADRLADAEVTELLNVTRPNTCKHAL